MKTVRTTEFIGNNTIEFVSDFFDFEKLDTRVLINNTEICTIAGCDIDNFTLELKNIINKYKI